MILYGRYDVHYLLRLRMLMMRDLVKLSLSNNFGPDLMEKDTDAMQDIMRECSEADGVDSDEDEGIDSHQLVSRDNNTSSVDDEKSLFLAQDLRINLDLMQVISSSQDRSLSLWVDRPENHTKDAEYLSLMAQNRINGKEWSMSQQKLYDRLAHWREEVGSKLGILPGFVCGSDLLAKFAQFRPASKLDVHQISYFVSSPLADHLSELMVLIRESRVEDKLPERGTYPSYEARKKYKASSKNLISDDTSGGSSKWLFCLGIVAALSAIAVLTKRRSR
jgi:ribonuclease D